MPAFVTAAGNLAKSLPEHQVRTCTSAEVVGLLRRALSNAGERVPGRAMYWRRAQAVGFQKSA